MCVCVCVIGSGIGIGTGRAALNTCGLDASDFENFLQLFDIEVRDADRLCLPGEVYVLQVKSRGAFFSHTH